MHHSIESGTAAADKDKNLGRWDNTYNAGNGNDKIRGGDGDDTLNGGYGRDKLYGGRGEDVLNGKADKDYLRGGSGKDILNGGVGYDKLFGGTGNDILNGGADRDKLYGGSGTDTLYGNAGKDKLRGGDGDDTIIGGNGEDTIRGGDDNDILYGGNGKDTLRGDGGNDIFVINTDDSKFDRVLDFLDGTDTMRIYTTNGNETTLAALNLRVVTDDTLFANTGHTAIMYTRGTSSTSDDKLIMGLQSVAASNITIADFEVLATSDPNYAVLDIV